MSKGRKTIVRHADGTVSTRTSQSKVYTHAVEIVRTVEARREWEICQIETLQGFIENYEEALKADAVTLVHENVGRGMVRSNYVLGGVFVGLGHKEAPSLEEARAKVAECLWTDVERQARYFDRLEAIVADEYAVLSWSSRADLAAKAAEDRGARYERSLGSIVRVVECEEA